MLLSLGASIYSYNFCNFTIKRFLKKIIFSFIHISTLHCRELLPTYTCIYLPTIYIPYLLCYGKNRRYSFLKTATRKMLWKPGLRHTHSRLATDAPDTDCTGQGSEGTWVWPFLLRTINPHGDVLMTCRLVYEFYEQINLQDSETVFSFYFIINFYSSPALVQSSMTFHDLPWLSMTLDENVQYDDVWLPYDQRKLDAILQWKWMFMDRKKVLWAEISWNF